MRTPRLAALLALALSPLALAQPDAPLWRTEEIGAGSPTTHRAKADPATLRALLATAPDEFGPGAPLVLDLPMLEGDVQRFAVRRSPVMAPELVARYPMIQTFVAQGLDDPSATARIDITPAGFHGLVSAAGRTVLITPTPRNDGEVTARDYHDADSSDWECLSTDHPAPLGPAYQARAVASLRTFRLALACTGEFTVEQSTLNGHASNVADGLAGLVTMTNRSNLILERDMGVRLELVANNDQLVFIDPDTDPYDGVDSNANLGANRTTCNTLIGSANYDVGHVVTRIPGGVAYLNAVCGSNKAGGVSGIPRTDRSDPLIVTVMLHELGHQFGANHTFNGSVDRCLSNRNGGTAWEPGSGTSIMAYAGGCPVGSFPAGDNLAIVSDLVYHVGSITEMRTFLSTIASCGTTTPTTNTTPTITSIPPLSSLSLPIGTPFEMVATATDNEGDSLTYSWEEMDLGPQQSLAGMVTSDNGLSPIFRVWVPQSSGGRIFPRLSGLLAGDIAPGERLPGATAARKFRVAVRDNHAGTGGVTISSQITLQFTSGAGPFAITAPAPRTNLLPGPLTVRWDVANTNISPIGTLIVRITLSTDAGATFPYVLANVASNDGEEIVTLPSITAPDAVIRVSAVDNVYCAFVPVSIAPCFADYNQDGGADLSDVIDLANDVAAGTSSFPGSSPDFNRDGAPDSGDVLDLANVVAGGSCP